MDVSLIWIVPLVIACVALSAYCFRKLLQRMDFESPYSAADAEYGKAPPLDDPYWDEEEEEEAAGVKLYSMALILLLLLSRVRM